MKIKRGLRFATVVIIAWISISSAVGQGMPTNLIVAVRHAPCLNGNGRIEGSLQQMLGEDVTLDGGFVLTGDLLVPGTPKLRLSGKPVFAGTVVGSGSVSPSGYEVTLKGNCSLNKLRTRTSPLALPAVAAPPPPMGKRNVTLNSAGQSIGDPATLRNLTLNCGARQVPVPPGTYGTFTANAGTGFILGVAGATQPRIYNLQNIALKGNSRLEVVGPVLLTVANGFSASGIVGATNHSSWLQIQIASCGLALNSGCTVHGSVIAPAGTVTVNGNSCLIGSAQCDRLTVNCGGVIRAGSVQNRAPVANAQSLSVNEDASLNFMLTGSDPEGGALTYVIVTQPVHGTLSLQPSTLNQFIYAPAANFNGDDTFAFKVNDGQADSVPATVSIAVTPVNDAPQLTVPGSQSIDENVRLVFNTNRLVSVADVDAGAGMLQLSLSVSNGAVFLAATNGLTWTAGKNGSAGLVVKGSLSDLNAALNGLAYLGSTNFFGADRLSLRVDDLGNTGAGGNLSDSKAISIVVMRINIPPAVAVASPAPQSEFAPGESIPVQVAASDPDGRVVAIKIFAEEMELAALTAPPFQILWTNAPAGEHVLSATAMDDDGAVSVSSNVLVTVLAPESGDFAVEAGPDQVIGLPGTASLAGTIGIQTPVAGAGTNVLWTKIDGPGNVQFSSAVSLTATAQFDEPGTYTLKLRATYHGGTRSDTLTVDALPAPSGRLISARSNRGEDFWLTFLPNEPFPGEPPYFGLGVIICADADTQGTVDYAAGVYGNLTPTRTRFQVRAGSATTVWVSGAGGDSDSIQPDAIHVTADHPVSVYGLDLLTESTDGYLALPTSMLGTNYIVLSYRNTPAWFNTNIVIGGTAFAVVAPENETRVVITPSVTTGSRIAGVPYEIVLQQGETHRLINEEGFDADLSGTFITADKPVAVFAGNKMTTIPPLTPSGDHLVEQLPPVNTWGRHFVTLPLAARTGGDTFRFLAGTDGTRVAINGKIAAALDRGQFYECILAEPAEILSSRPILAAQYANSSQYDGAMGDPSMMLVPPLEQFGGDYLLSTPADIWNVYNQDYEDIYTNYLNLVVRTNGVGLIQLDGVAVPASAFRAGTNSGYAGAQLPVVPGAHHLSAPVPFGVCVYGWAPSESYAFMGGICSETVEAGAKMELEQPTGFALTGQEKFVTARVKDGRGRPAADLEVEFAVAGANLASGRAATSRFGEAAFSYTGTNAGADVITATLVDLAESVTNTWIGPGHNTPPVVSAAGTPPRQFGLTARLMGAAGDDGNPAGSKLNVRWVLLDGPADVQFDDPSQLDTQAVCTESGSYLFGLIADDSQFSSRDQVRVFVDQLPQVQFPSAEIPAVAAVGSEIPLGAIALDLDGSIDRVEFYANDILIGTATNGDWQGNYNCNWIPGTNGWFQLRAVACDDQGGSAGSDAVSIRITFPPQIQMVLPDHDSALPYGASTTTFRALAWDSDGAVTNFAVYVGPMLIYQTAGDRIDFTGPVDVGDSFYGKYATHQVHFIATDNLGISTEVYGVNLTLEPPSITVNLVAPAEDQVFQVGQPVDFLAEASATAPATVGFVGFFRQDVNWSGDVIWSWLVYPPDDTPPFTTQWTPTQAGDYAFKACAGINAWTTEMSPVRHIHVVPASIGVSIVSPADSAQLFMGRSWQISLALDDPAGAFDHAEFFANGISLGQTTNSSWSWFPAQSGDYTLTAAVFDRQGQSYNAAKSVSVRVNPPSVPVLSLELITADEKHNVVVGAPSLLVAHVSVDAPARIAKVEFFEDGQIVGAVSNTPFQFRYAAKNPEPHLLTARATTDLGTSADSPTLTVQGILRLGVLWEGVRSGEWVPVGTNKSLGVRLRDPGSVFDHVEFLANGVVLASTDRCFFDWAPAAAGDYTLRARAYDRFGNASDTEEIVLHSAVLHGPRVCFLTPSPMARFAAGQPVVFTVQATDGECAVTNVSLYRFSRPQVSTPGDTLSYTWTNLPARAHQFTAVATDERGLTGVAKVRIVVNAPVDAELLPPRNLSAQVLGCNAIRISWDTNSGVATHLVVVERAEGTNETWEIANKVPLQAGAMSDLFLHAATMYRYRAYVSDRALRRSVDSNIITARTRAYIPGFGVLDLAENIEDAGAFNAAGANDERQPENSIVAQLEVGNARCRPVPAGPAGSRQKSVAPPDTMIYKAAFNEQNDASTVLDLNGMLALGISDINSVLLLGPSINFLWRPGGGYETLADANFYPLRLTRFGFPVGTRLGEFSGAPFNTLKQYHAGYWHNGFVDLTPEVQALREPASLPPLITPYSVSDSILGISMSGVAVGVATWVWVYSIDGQTSTLWLGPLPNATVWPGDNQPPLNFGSLQPMVGESEFQAINDAGDIVGASAFVDPAMPEAKSTHAIRSQLSLAAALGNKLTDLGTLGGSFSAAIGINNDGVAVGYSTLQPQDAITNTHAVCWLLTETQPRPLPDYGAGLMSYAWSINDGGQIAGDAADTNGIQQAVLWNPNPGATNGLGYDLVNLNDLAGRADWHLDSARSINGSGFVVGSGSHLTQFVTDGGATQTASVPRPFLLIPGTSLAVDYNRDGRIELNQNDHLPEGKPYQFWINDDSDGSSVDSVLGISDLPGARSGLFEFDGRTPDFDDSQVNGVADLVDWFPVFLNISNLLAVLPASQYEYRLIHSEAALNFLYTGLRPDEAGAYRTNAWASGFGIDFSQTAATATGVQNVTADGIAIPAGFLDEIAHNGRGVLLFEACKAKTQPLRLEVRNHDGRVATSLELPLQISGAEAMYGWANLRPVAGGAAERPTNIQPANWPIFARDDQAFVFVHGYNVNERQSRAWAAEMFKRLWWSGSHRRFYAASWFGNDTQVADEVTINYHTNVVHAFQTAPVLANLLNVWLDGQDVTVAAHSLGNMVVCSAIEDYWAWADRYYMVDSAIAMEAFDAGLTNQSFMTHPDWRDYPERLYASEWHQLFPDGDGRRALTWRGRFQDVPQFTELYNFYSSGEEVLENRPGNDDPTALDLIALQIQLDDPGFLVGQYPWALQELLKGRATVRAVAKAYLEIAAIPVYGAFLDLALYLEGVRAGNILGSQFGGWGFNSSWDISGSLSTVTVGDITLPIYIPGDHLPFAPAGNLSDDQLKTNSFFLPFSDSRLYQPDGSAVASGDASRAQFLAEDIPARTFATGANVFEEARFGEGRQFNMNMDFQKRGWPLDRRSSMKQARWLHSDLHDIAYQYNGMVFDKFVELEGGR